MLQCVAAIFCVLVSYVRASAQPDQRILRVDFGDLDIPVISGSAPFTVSSNGALASTYYVIFGDLNKKDQIPLVVGHGGGGTHHYLASLSNFTRDHDIPIILYDQVGFGMSSQFPEQLGNTTFWTINPFVEQLQQLISYLGVETEYDYMGHSYGTAYGINFAADKAVRQGLRRLVLWSPVASMPLLHESLRKRRAALPDDLRAILEQHEADGTTDSKEYRKAMMASMHYDFCRLDVWPDELLESLSYTSASAAATLFGNILLETNGTLNSWSALEIAANITMPTLLLNGHYDWSDVAVEPLARKIPSVEWVRFDNSSHLLHFEEPSKFLEVVTTFLKGLKTDNHAS